MTSRRQQIPDAGWRIRAALGATLVALLALSGCATGQATQALGTSQEGTGEEETMPEQPSTGLLDEAEANEATVLARLAEAKELIAGDDPGPWSDETELELMPCSDNEYSYVTRLAYGNTDGWRFPGDALTFREAVGQRFVDAGWQDISGKNIDDGNAFSMTASWPDEVRELLIMFHPGEVADGLTVYLESACWQGSVNDIWKLQKEKYRGS